MKRKGIQHQKSRQLESSAYKPERHIIGQSTPNFELAFST